MGIDYSSSLAIGWRVRAEQLKQVFGKYTPEQAHMEDRYDPKTGKKLLPEKVIDQRAGTVLMFEGQECDYIEQLVEAICDKTGATFWHDGSFMCDQEDMEYIIGPSFELDTEGKDEGRVTTGGGILFAKVVELAPELQRIGIELRKLGLDIGSAEITTTLLIS
jgi:hypothetical protein